MKVTILRSFVGYVGKTKHRCQVGEVVEMPEGADWVRAGLAAVVPTVVLPDEERPRKSAKAKG